MNRRLKKGDIDEKALLASIYVKKNPDDTEFINQFLSKAEGKKFRKGKIQRREIREKGKEKIRMITERSF